MTQKIKAVLKSRAGFSLVEMLLAMMILMMGGSIIVGGLPVAAEVLRKVVDTANAQVLMTTTMVRLRDELGTATELSSDSESRIIRYTNTDGRKAAIGYWDGTPNALWDGSSDVQGLYIREYYGYGEDSSDTYLLVSNAASNKNLYADYVSGTYNSSDGIFTMTGFTVRRRRDPAEILASSDEYKIWVLSAPQP